MEGSCHVAVRPVSRLRGLRGRERGTFLRILHLGFIFVMPLAVFVVRVVLPT